MQKKDAKIRPVRIACFGEALWDVLPRGIFLGGAPLNVAYHLSRQGVRSLPISAVGRDFLGDEALRRIASWGVDARFVTRDRALPTGVVRATLDRSGAASYQIVRHVAWDRIATPATLLRQPSPTAIVFGSLALRETPNRRALQRLCDAWPESLRVLDLNLRAPFDRGEAIRVALAHAQLLKLNDEELARLTKRPTRSPRQLERAARELAAQHNLSRICVTAGARGAGLWWDGTWIWEAAREVAVRDTVGAGDSFLAAFLASLFLRRATPDAALAAACRVGEFVASRDGATPHYEVDARGRPREARRAQT